MTDPTITIAGLRAQVATLIDHLDSANTSRGDFSSLYSQHSAKVAAAEAERDALAAQLAEVRAELVQLGGADLARDAAEDRAARLDADLAKVRAELAAAPKVCAIHSYALEGPCMTCGAPWPGAEKALRQDRIEGMEKMRRISAAVGCPNSVEEVVEAVAAIKSDLASERAHLAACQTRIAGLEQAADERSAEVARLTARVAELEARPVLTHEILSAAIKKASKVPPYIARQAADEYMPHLGPVMLPAQDRAEELTDAIESRLAAIGFSGFGGRISYTDRIRIVEESLASLGAPPTSPTQDDPMRHHESRDYALQSPANGYWPADVGAVNGTEAMVMGAMLRSVGPHPISDAALIAMARTAIECVDKLGAPPTSPPAARPVFAGVSEEELALEYARAVDRIPGIRAVLARLEVSLVAPVDPEAVARDYANNAATGYAPGIDHPPYWFEYTDEQRTKRTAAMRATLTAAGIPVTPEVGK